LPNDQGVSSGRAQAAVRLLSPIVFATIIERGLSSDADILPCVDQFGHGDGFADPRQDFLHLSGRDRVNQLTNRAVRNRNFRKTVLRAYDERCAITGMKLLNCGGRAEVEAAHIRPVERDGPDIVSNGSALSATAHWMFDRGLVGLADDLTVIVSRHANDQRAEESIINETGALLSLSRPPERPRARIVAWHCAHGFMS